jgi:hypothetical protein
MKKRLLIGSVLLAAITTYSQNARLKPVTTGIINTKTIAKAKFGGAENSVVLRNPVANSPENSQASASKAAVTNTWNPFTSSMNIYGTIIGYTKPLQWNDELNAVSFIHRKSPTYAPVPTPAVNAANGSIVAMISSNCGGTWDSTAIWANDNFWGRYPGGAIYNPPSTPTNTNINNAYVVGAGPTTGQSAATWIGNWYASKQLNVFNNIPSTAPNAQQVASAPFTPTLPKHDFSAYSFTGTDDGKMRIIAGVTDDALASDTAVMLITGTFNNGVFDWAGQVFNPPTIMASDGTEQWISRPMMAWNEQGTVGYLVIMGANVNGVGSNVGMQPIVYKTTNSGGTWSLENGIDFNSSAFADVKRSISAVSTNTSLEVPFFNWIEGMDCAVDINNKLHIFSTVIGTFSDHPDSLQFIGQFGADGYRWPHSPGFRPYLYDFIYDGTNTNPSWSHIVVDSMSTEGPAGVSTGDGYQENPWDMDPSQQNQKVRIDARLQMSRTPDGKYLVYSWAESDTNFTNNQKKWNTLPNVKVRVMDATTGLVCQTGATFGELNVTASGPGDVAGRAMYHFISPKCRLSSTVTANGPVIGVPMTVSNSSPYSQLTENKHWFSWAILNFGNVPDPSITLCGTAAEPPITVGYAETASNSANSSYVFPNPAKNNATLNINLVKNGTVNIEVLNTIGQVVKSTRAEGQSGVNSINVDLSGLSSGIYMVNIKVDNASSTKKLVIE